MNLTKDGVSYKKGFLKIQQMVNFNGKIQFSGKIRADVSEAADICKC